MSLAQRMHFLQDVFQMTIIALVSVINHNHINGLYLFWYTLYIERRNWLNHFVHLVVKILMATAELPAKIIPYYQRAFKACNLCGLTILPFFILFYFYRWSRVSIFISFTPWEFFTSALVDGLSLEFEWQQVSSSLQDSSQYSRHSQQCCHLDDLHSSANFQVRQSP